MASNIYALAALPWALILIHFIESSLHFAIISNQAEKIWWNRLWHIEFFRLWVIIYLMLWAVGVPETVLLAGGISRLVVFPIRLNLFRELPWYHLGTKGIDAIVGRLPVTGRKIYFVVLGCAVLALAVVHTVRVLM